MSDLTWFGWLYVILAVAGSLFQISRIGVRREPLDASDVICIIIVQALYVWGFAAVGFSQ